MGLEYDPQAHKSTVLGWLVPVVKHQTEMSG